MLYFLVILILFASAILFVKILGVRKMILHPATFFFAIWIVSVVSEWVFDSMGLAFIVDRVYINELLLYVAYTVLCFDLVLLINKRKVNNISIKFDRMIGNIHAYKLLSCLYLLSVIILFVINGRSFNMAQNRSDMLGAGNTTYSLLSILTSFGFVLHLISGYLLSEKYINKRKIGVGSIWFFIPIVVGIMQGVLIGGRNPIMIMIKYCLIGVGLSIIYINSKQLLYKFAAYAIIVITIFSFFSTHVDDQRHELSGISAFSENFSNPILRQFSGIMHYSTAHYLGYQCRRIDYVDEDNLLYGAATFYGLGSLKLPLLPVKFMIWDLYTDYTPKELYFDLKYDYYFTTNSIYLYLMKDFGRYGMLVVILLLVVFTQLSYNRLLSYRGKNICALFFYLLFYSYWGSSNFDSSMNGPVYMTILLPLIIFDIIKR